VVTSLREGIKPKEIAYYFGEMGWLTVSEKSFTQYIQAYRRIYPEEIGGNADQQHLDHHIDPRNPHLDEEAALEQLIRMQKVRLGIGLKFEKDTGLLNNHLHKDINATTEMVETLAKMRGRMMGAGRPSSESLQQMPNEAKEQLRENDQREVQQTRLSNLFERLGGMLKEKQAQDAAS
jgi:hypothetical protein